MSHFMYFIACLGCSQLITSPCNHAFASPDSDSLGSGSFQLQAGGAQLSVQLLHVVVMGDRELHDPSVLFR